MGAKESKRYDAEEDERERKESDTPGCFSGGERFMHALERYQIRVKKSKK